MTNFQGQTFAGYEIISQLGRGGMGSVYKARQPKLDRLAALKVLASDLASDPDFVARFRREAAAAANLSHPNVVQVYSAGESEGTHYIAMEFVDGVTVRQHIEQHGRLDPREAIAITIYVAEALQYAWNKAKLIHRDIKPENIFLSQTGEVKVGDLGLAKTVGGGTTSLTQTGMLMGSPHYISPEQARGLGDMDFRTDIYSLGCTLYHMLTGRPPYTGTDPLVVITKHVNEPPPAIFKVWPTCPIPLALVLGKMLAKRPHERPASYEDLIEQLHEVRGKLKPATVAAAAPVSASEPAQALPTPAPKAQGSKPATRDSRLMIGFGVGVGVLLLAGLLFWSTWKSAAPGDDAFAREVAALPAEQQLERVMQKLKELNPGFDGRETHKMENNAVVELKMSATKLTNISPVAALRQLRMFQCNASPQARSSLADISPLRGLPLASLELNETEVGDLSPLAGMPLVHLHIHCPKVTDLSPLKGMKLKRFCCASTQVSDLSPLQGMKLEWFVCDPAMVKSPGNLAVLRDMTMLKTICHKPTAEFWKQLETGQSLSAGHPTEDTGATAGTAATDADWQNAINLLPLIDIEKDKVSGTWTAANGELSATDVKAASQKLQPPYRPPQEYDCRVCFSVTGGDGNVATGLSVAGHSFVCLIKTNQSDHVMGFEAINHKAVLNNTTATHLPHLECGRRYTMLVEVRKEAVTAYLDGKRMTAWQTDYRDMGPWPIWKFGDDSLLGIGCVKTAAIFHEMKVLEISSKGAFTRDVPAAAAGAITGTEAGSSTPSNALSDEDKRAGFELLFNGSDLDGWEHDGRWMVEDHAIAFNSRGRDIVCKLKRLPSDFELRFEWKVAPGSNSGVFYRPRTEYQIVDNAGHKDGQSPRTAAASLWNTVPVTRDATRPFGEWNEGRIVCKGSVIEHWLNGEKVMDFDFNDPARADAADALRNRGGGPGQSGELALQAHTGRAWFRNIKLRTL